MIVFLSYSRKQSDVAEEVQLALAGLGHEVFYDRDALRAGKEFHSRIREEIDRSEAFVFLISPQSVSKGSYARTELKFAKEKWPDPVQKVFPVMVEHTEIAQVPAYLKATVTILEPEGDVAAEVAAEFEKWTEHSTEPEPPPRTSQLAEYIPGTWLLQVRYPNGFSAQATVETYGNGAFRTRGTYPGGMYTIEGSWRVLGPDELLLSGQQNDGYQITSFDRTVRFSRISRNSFAGVMSSGEDLVWHRVG